MMPRARESHPIITTFKRQLITLWEIQSSARREIPWLRRENDIFQARERRNIHPTSFIFKWQAELFISRLKAKLRAWSVGRTTTLLLLLLLRYLFILLLFCVFLELHLSFIRARSARVGDASQFAASSQRTKALQFLYLCISRAFRMWSSRDLPKSVQRERYSSILCTFAGADRAANSRAAPVSAFPPTFNCTLIVSLHLKPRRRAWSEFIICWCTPQWSNVFAVVLTKLYNNMHNCVAEKWEIHILIFADR